MFLGEVQIIQAISHENVVRVFEVSEENGTLYMAMEWVEGDSLRNIIKAAKSRGALPPEIAVRIAADAAAGLHAAHELRGWDGELRGVVHCDVSPHNVLVGIDGKAKLVDFGIANALGRLGQAGDGEQIKGKLSYMSPEQARGEHVDRRTDVFALGIVLFEMTTGEQLFKGRDAAHTLELVRHGTIPRPSTLNPRYPEGLEAVVMHALERDPERRFQTAHEFEQALTQFLYEERILVSHSAVAQLLLRVMGPRIEKRRDVITTIVQAVDGHLKVGELGPHQLAALADLSPMHSDPFNYTLTNAGEANALGIAARLESHTVVARPISTPPPEEPVLIEPDPSTIPWLWVSIAGAILVVGAVVAYVVASRSQSSTIDLAAHQEASGAATNATRPTATPEPADPDKSHDRGHSAESLPVAGESLQVASPYAGRRGAKARQSDKEATADAPDRKASGSAKNAETAAEKANEQEVTAETIVLDGDPTKPAAGEAGINKAAVNLALAMAAAAARACRSQGDSPTGQGRAAVTFAADGSAVAVSLSQRFTGTSIGSCVAAQFRQVHAPAFSGDSVTLFYPFEIPQ